MQTDIRNLINDYIVKGNEDIEYWQKGKNLYAENIADKIAEQNKKLHKLLSAETLDTETIKNLIETETESELIIIYEEILEILADGTEDG